MGEHEETIKQRGKEYGKFGNNVNFVADFLDLMDRYTVLQTGQSADSEHRAFLTYVGIKLARLTNSPRHIDTIHDLSNYFQLYERVLKGEDI
jgi:hypothetical protein